MLHPPLPSSMSETATLWNSAGFRGRQLVAAPTAALKQTLAPIPYPSRSLPVGLLQPAAPFPTAPARPPRRRAVSFGALGDEKGLA